MTQISEEPEDPFLVGIKCLLEACARVGPMSDYPDPMKITEYKANEFASKCATATLLSLLVAARHLSGIYQLHGKLEGEMFAGARLSTLDDFYFNILRALEAKHCVPADDVLIFHFLSNLVGVASDDDLLQTCVQAIGNCSSISEKAVEFLLNQAIRLDTTEEYRIAIIESITEMHSVEANRRVFEVKGYPSMQSPRIQRRLAEVFQFIESKERKMGIQQVKIVNE